MLKSLTKSTVKKSVMEKWEKIIDGFQKTAPIKPSKKEAMAQILENEMKYLPKVLNESNSSIGSFMDAAGTSALGTVPFYIGVLRRGYPKLIGMNLMGVQALKQPGGVLFAVKRTLQGSTNQQTTLGGSLNTINSRVLVLSAALTLQGTGIVALTITDDTTAANTAVVNCVYADDKFALVTQLGSGATAGGMALLDSWGSSATFTYSGTTYTINSVTSNQNLFTYVFKEYSMFYDANGTPQNDDFAGSDIREAGTDVIKVPITNIKSRKIKSKLSQELIEDMNAYGHDIQNDLMNLMMEDITAEQNREFLARIRSAAETPLPTYDFTASDTTAPTTLDRYVKIVSKATQLSNKIAKDLKSGGGNYMVVSPGILSAFTILSKYWMSFNTSVQNMNLTGGNEYASDPYVGKFNDFWNLYVDIFADDMNSLGVTTESVIVGHYSDNNMDNAFFYLPYIALIPDIMKNPDDGQWRLIYRTRYAIQENPFGASKWIKKLEVSNFQI